MNKRIKELADEADKLWDGASPENSEWCEKFAELIVNDVLGCYHAIDNGNKVEGTEDFVKAVMKRYNLGKKK